MTFSGNIQINIFALLMLAVLFFSVSRRSKNLLPDEKMYLSIVVSTMLILFWDAVQWLIDRQAGVVMIVLNTASSIIYYTLTPVVCLLWCFYVRYQFSMDKKDTKARVLLSIPTVFGAVISAASVFTGWFFSVDAANRYQRGNMFWLMLLIVFGYLVYAFVYTIANRRRLEKAVFLSLLSFTVLPVTGGTIQALYYGLSLVWPCVALSLLIIYIYIQNNRLNTDHLSGLYNRRQIEVYLDSFLKKGKTGLGGIMLDIDDFKMINDKYGHPTGDQAIFDASAILKQSVQKNGFLARYGGDEFVVFIPAQTPEDVELVVSAIKICADVYNRQSKAPYQIRFSMGYDVFLPDKALSHEQILSRIDALMYENKQSRKALDSLSDEL